MKQRAPFPAEHAPRAQARSLGRRADLAELKCRGAFRCATRRRRAETEALEQLPEELLHGVAGAEIAEPLDLPMQPDA